MSKDTFRVYECPVCHQWYNSHDKLKWHYDTDHPEYEALETITQKAPDAQPRFAFQCTECGQLFHGGDELKRHMYEKHPTTAHDVYGRVDPTILPVEWKPVSPWEGQWTLQQIQDRLNQGNPLYPPNMLKRIEQLEKQVAMLLEALTAGK